MELFLTSAANVVTKDITTKIDTKGKKLVFIYTAAEVEEGGKDADWCQADRQSLIDVGFELGDYTISEKSADELEKELGGFDVIFVSGGNTFYLLQQAQKSGFIEVVKDLLNRGKLYIGSSAGSCVAGPSIYPIRNIDSPDMAPKLNGYDGFGLVNFLVLPHWGSLDFKTEYVGSTELNYSEDQVPMVILTDRQYVWVRDGKFEIVEVK
jgi:dipeptidase E